MDYELLVGDCREELPKLDESSVDSVVTDPPYELGFMGKKWDGTGVAFSPETWKAVLRVLKPGGYLLAFGGTRTEHRMTCAIEDAGFIIQDKLCWLYGTGFPKGKTQLKPAYEPIVMAYKPGKRVINVEESRIAGGSYPLNTYVAGPRFAPGVEAPKNDPYTTRQSIGRWPANVILDEAAAAELDAQSGETQSPGRITRGDNRASHSGGFAMGRSENVLVPSDFGGASRFFYVAKASSAERGKGNTHPTIKPIALMEHLIKLVTPADGIALDPFAGSGSTLIAALRLERRAIGIEQSPEYAEIIRARIRAEAPMLGL